MPIFEKTVLPLLFRFPLLLESFFIGRLTYSYTEQHRPNSLWFIRFLYISPQTPPFYHTTHVSPSSVSFTSSDHTFLRSRYVSDSCTQSRMIRFKYPPNISILYKIGFFRFAPTDFLVLRFFTS